MPRVAEVVLVAQAPEAVVDHVTELHQPGTASELAFRQLVQIVRDRDSLVADLEHVEVAIRPAKRRLQQFVELGQRDGRRHLEPPPDGRGDLVERHLQPAGATVVAEPVAWTNDRGGWPGRQANRADLGRVDRSHLVALPDEEDVAITLDDGNPGGG